MLKFRKLSALALVAAVTISMLPVFAAAGETAAVEDVAPVAAEASAPAPVAETIETAPTEAVAPKAELQTVNVSDSDHAKVVMLEGPNAGDETGYATIEAAYQAAAASEDLCEIVVLKDLTYYISGTQAYAIGALNGSYGNGDSTHHTWNVENTSDPDVTVHGFWLNLNGHTVTVNCQDTSENKHYRPMFFTNNAPINVKNGTLIYKLGRTGGKTAVCLVTAGYGTSTTNKSDIGTAERLWMPEITFKNVNAYRVKSGSYASEGPVITVADLGSDIRIIDSKLVSQNHYVVNYAKNIYGATAPEEYTNGTKRAAHNLYIKNSTLGSTSSSYSAIRSGSIAKGVQVGCDATITLAGEVSFFGAENPVEWDSSGPILSFPAVSSYEASTTNTAIPNVSTFATATAVGAVPGFSAEAAYSGRTYTVAESCDHPNRYEVAAQAPTWSTQGNLAHWYCPDCLTYWEADGVTQTTAGALTIAKLKPTDAAGKSDSELVELGAVIKAVSPDASVKAYDNIKDGYNEAKTWTEAGGSLLLLQDVVIEDAENSGITGYMTGQTFSYDNNEVDGLPTTGFWFDLGGHVIDARLGMPLFYTAAAATFNLKNGTILFANNGRTYTLLYAPFVFGYSSVTPLSDEGDVKQVALNLHEVNVYALPNVSGAAVAACVCSSIMNTTVNVKDSRLISTNAGRAPISFYMTTSDKTNAYYEAAGSNLIVNLTDGAVVGSTDAETEAICCAPYNAAAKCIERVTYSLTVDAGEDTVFLGKVPVSTADYVTANYRTIKTPNDDYLEATKNYAFPEIPLSAADYAAWVYADRDKATVTYGGETAGFKKIAEAFTFAETVGAANPGTVITLNAPVKATCALGATGETSAFTLDLNGQSIPAAGLFDASGASGKTVTVTMTGGGTAKLFKGMPAFTYADGDSFAVCKDAFFSDYSLNLEDNVSINLYTATADPDAVYYVQEGKEYTIAAPGEHHDWVVDTLAAKQMCVTVDAYAVKTEGTVTTIDFSKGVSVKGYVDSNPTQKGAGVQEALDDVLDTMMIYGKFAEKYFAGDCSDLNAAEMAEIGVDEIPATDTSNLAAAHVDYAVTGMGDHLADNSVTSGYWGSAAVLQDSILLKFYFKGMDFNGKSITVNGKAAEFSTTIEGFRFVKAPVNAKDFAAAITVAVEGIGTVTDSVEAYTARILADETKTDVHKLAQALRAYGADAMRYAAAKAAAEG